VPVIISSAAFTSFNRKAVVRCRLTFAANTLSVGATIDPVPSNNTMSVELNVIDMNDPEQMTVHESVISSIAPIAVTIPRSTGTLAVTVRPKVGNADYLVVSDTHALTVTASDGDCPSGTVGVVDLDRHTPGTQNVVVLAGGHTRGGLLALTINAGAFATANAASPNRCAALLRVDGPAGNVEPDSTNNTTRLVIDVLDHNDF
jgi:hypothetical protein